MSIGVASPSGLSCRSTLWGLPLQKAEISVSDFREIWVRRVHNGAHLQFFSPRHLLGGRVCNRSKFEISTGDLPQVGAPQKLLKSAAVAQLVGLDSTERSNSIS